MLQDIFDVDAYADAVAWQICREMPPMGVAVGSLYISKLSFTFSHMVDKSLLLVICRGVHGKILAP